MWCAADTHRRGTAGRINEVQLGSQAMEDKVLVSNSFGAGLEASS